jgi:glycosyltransferase involved in cell wall biosynthesis
MSIIIIGEVFSLPASEAPSNWVHTIAKGFVKNEINIHVISLSHDYRPIKREIDGFYYYSALNQYKRKKYFIFRLFFRFRKYFNIIKYINIYRRTEQSFSLIVYSVSFIVIVYSIFIAKIYKSNLVWIGSEHPVRKNFRSNQFKSFLEYLYASFISLFFDGIIAFSYYLQNFYLCKSIWPKKYKAKIVIIPPAVEFERFNQSYSKPFDFQYIVYCGTLSVVKDGVNILIEAFSEIEKTFPEIKLVLIGPPNSNSEMQLFQSLVNKYDLQHKTVFVGKISRDQMAKYLCNSSVLVLSRPTSIQADSGFPSKLAEYLATGKPVIVTKVGDIPKYLKDNKTAFLADPNSIHDFANKMSFVLSNYKFSLTVGKEGAKLCNKMFNNKSQSGKIIHFISKLKYPSF